MKAILGVALAARVAALFLWPPDVNARVEVNPWSDTRGYDTLAERLATGRTYEIDGVRAMYPPGYPLFVSSFYALFGRSVWPVVIAQVLLSTLAIGLFFDASRRFAPRPVAAIAALIMAVHPDVLYRMAILETETLYVFLLTLAFWLVATRRPLGAGLASGAMILTRVPGLAPAACLGLFWLFIGPTWKKRLSSAALFGLGCALPLIPWAIRNNGILGSPTISVTMGAWLLDVGTRQHMVDADPDVTADAFWRYAALPERERYAAMRSDAIARIKADPRRYASFCWARTHRYWYPPLEWPEEGKPTAVAGTALALLVLAFSIATGNFMLGACAVFGGALAAVAGDRHLFGLQFAAPLAVGAAIAGRRGLWLTGSIALLASAPYILTSASLRYRLGTESLLILTSLAGATYVAARLRRTTMTPDIDREPNPLLSRPVLAMTTLVGIGLAVVGWKQISSQPTTPDAVGTTPFNRLQDERRANLGYVDASEGQEIMLTGTIRYPLATARFRRISRPLVAGYVYAFLLSVDDGAEPRDVVAYSREPLPYEHGAHVRVRARILGPIRDGALNDPIKHEPHRGLVVEALDVVP